MTWEVEFLSEAKRDLRKLDNSVQKQVLKGIIKVSQNPLPNQQGGYGKPLGNKNSNNLTNCLKIKFSKLGIRVVYTIKYDREIMLVIVISARADGEVYKEASSRITRHSEDDW